MSRKTSEDEKALFAKHFAETRPLAPTTRRAALAKPSQLGPTGLNGATQDRLRRGVLEPDARLDLHGMTERDAHRALLVFLKSAQMRGCRLVLVVTGKGRPQADDAPFDMELNRRSRGVLKSAVPRWLSEREFAGLVAGTQAAHKRHGGEGALYIYLRRAR